MLKPKVAVIRHIHRKIDCEQGAQKIDQSCYTKPLVKVGSQSRPVNKITSWRLVIIATGDKITSCAASTTTNSCLSCLAVTARLGNKKETPSYFPLLNLI